MNANKENGDIKEHVISSIKQVFSSEGQNKQTFTLIKEEIDGQIRSQYR